MAVTNKVKEQQRVKELEHSDRYYYNKEADKYIVHSKAAAKNLVITGETHRNMLNAYSGSDPRSTEEICMTYNIPAFIFNEYRAIFGWTRDGIPLSEEELVANTVEESVNSLAERKRFEVSQKYNKDEWLRTQERAKKWEDFEAKVLNPFDSFVSKIKPIGHKKQTIKEDKDSNEHIILGLSDTHWGAHSSARYLFNKEKKGWSIEDTNKAIDNYCTQLLKFSKSKKEKFNSATILSAGDILHSLSGETAKGTKIDTWPLGEEQWDIAFDSLCRFIQNMSDIFPLSNVVSLTGNHDVRDATLFKCLASYFRNFESVKFDIHDSRWCSFNLAGCGIIAEHGYSPIYNRAKLPKSGPGREAQIQRLIIENIDQFKDVKQILYISADQHHFEANERGFYTQIMFSTLVKFDRYADNHNLRGNRAQQNAVVINSEGLKEIVSFYLD